MAKKKKYIFVAASTILLPVRIVCHVFFVALFVDFFYAFLVLVSCFLCKYYRAA